MKNYFFAFLIFCSALFFSNSVFAYELKNFNNIENTGDFLIKPIKSEISLDQGQERIINLDVLNRTGKAMEFSLEIKDFSAQNNVELLDKNNNPYSLSDYIFPETSWFSLKHGEQITIPIQIKIPQYANPQSMHTAIVVFAKEPNGKVLTGIASLFLTTIKGKTLLDGKLIDFKFFHNGDDKKFDLVFTNSGDAYLNPNGKILIFDWKNKEITHLVINNFFVLPKTTRTQEFFLPWGEFFGKYKARVELNRGYGSLIDIKEIDFWIIEERFWIGLVFFISIFAFVKKVRDFNR